MAKETNPEVAVYLFTGFLESGKTQFIKESVISDPNFMTNEKTLLLIAEEGEEEYDTEALLKQGIYTEVVENEIDLSPKILTYLLNKHECKRVLLEYNGMWQLSSLYNGLPENWMIYQEFCFVNAPTFLNFNNNMRQLVVDKLQSADLVVFNRFEKTMDKTEYHKIVRAISKRAQIVYEYTDGDFENDDIEDPLPFDLNADVVEIKDGDFAEWYRDITTEPKKYINKVIELKGIVSRNDRFEPDMFAFGRRLMTCCVEDIQFCSLLARGNSKQMPVVKSWYKARFKVEYKFHRMYGQKGPILNVVEMEETSAPEQEVATFY